MKRFVPYLVLLLLACETTIDIDPDTGFEIFTIGAGQHSSINKNEVFSGDGIEFKVIFDESAEYISQDDNNQGDINKLLGFSQCGEHHQSESARIGWRWYEDELQLLAYVYTNSDRKYELLGAIPINQEVNVRIEIEAERYRFSGDGFSETFIQRSGTRCSSGDNNWLWPYFGGDESAPHDILIKIERVAL